MYIPGYTKWPILIPLCVIPDAQTYTWFYSLAVIIKSESESRLFVCPPSNFSDILSIVRLTSLCEGHINNSFFHKHSEEASVFNQVQCGEPVAQIYWVHQHSAKDLQNCGASLQGWLNHPDILNRSSTSVSHQSST